MWLRKIGDSNTSNLWHHLESHYPDKDPKRAKIDGQSTLDEFMDTEFSFKVYIIYKIETNFVIKFIYILHFFLVYTGKFLLKKFIL